MIDHALRTYEKKLLPFYQKYLGTDEHEQSAVDTFKKFVASYENHLYRECLTGHITGSALVCNLEMTSVVLTLHGKLKEWLQLGGHADGDPCIFNVAMKEAYEESGLKRLILFPIMDLVEPKRTINLFYDCMVPFDLDYHKIKQHKDVPEHIHYDVRYLIIAKDQDLIRSEESDDLRWFSLEEASRLCPSEAMQRQFRKLNLIREKYYG